MKALDILGSRPRDLDPDGFLDLPCNTSIPVSRIKRSEPLKNPNQILRSG